jgi:hypothetical protein
MFMAFSGRAPNLASRILLGLLNDDRAALRFRCSAGRHSVAELDENWFAVGGCDGGGSFNTSQARGALTQHSNRVSTNACLRRRETQFSRADAGVYKSRRLRLALAHTLKDDRGVQHGFSIPPLS